MYRPDLGVLAGLSDYFARPRYISKEVRMTGGDTGIRACRANARARETDGTSCEDGRGFQGDFRCANISRKFWNRRLVASWMRGSQTSLDHPLARGSLD